MYVIINTEHYDGEADPRVVTATEDPAKANSKLGEVLESNKERIMESHKDTSIYSPDGNHQSFTEDYITHEWHDLLMATYTYADISDDNIGFITKIFKSTDEDKYVVIAPNELAK